MIQEEQQKIQQEKEEEEKAAKKKAAMQAHADRKAKALAMKMAVEEKKNSGEGGST